jgi:hypothetical protein
MSANKLTYAQMRNTAKLYNEAKGNYVHAAKAAGLARGTFQDRCRTARTHHPEFFKSFPRSAGGMAPLPGTLKAPLSVDESVRVHRAEQLARESDGRLKDAIKQLAILEDRLRDLEWANNISLKPADWTFREYASGKKREHIPELFGSDWQVGEVIRESETEAGYGYDAAIFVTRYRRMVDTVNYLSHHHGGSGWTYPGLIYLRGGDTIDGGIHPEDAGEQVLTPLQCVELVFEEEARGLELLAEAFGRVDVKTPGSAGNHDRTNFKPVSKKAFAHNYDRLIHKMLVNHFRKDKRVTFQTSESFDLRYKIYEQNVLLTHGDRMSAGGGTGFIGPIANILKGWQKVTMEQAALGFKVDQIRTGHYHTPFWTPYGWGNGCMPGYSEFAKGFRMRPTPPMQLFGFHHHKRGLVDMKPLVLVD